jgi:hypothetical protein
VTSLFAAGFFALLALHPRAARAHSPRRARSWYRRPADLLPSRIVLDLQPTAWAPLPVPAWRSVSALLSGKMHALRHRWEPAKRWAGLLALWLFPAQPGDPHSVMAICVGCFIFRRCCIRAVRCAWLVAIACSHPA